MRRTMSASIPATARRLFPQGGDSLLAWLDDWADRRMLADVERVELARLPVRRRIALLVRTRLEAADRHIARRSGVRWRPGACPATSPARAGAPCGARSI